MSDELVKYNEELGLAENEVEFWQPIRKDIIESVLSLHQISEKYKVPKTLIEQKANRAGWLSKRDKSDNAKATDNLNKVIRDTAFQLNDIYGHTSAMLEAIQYAFHIQIKRDNSGAIHYRWLETKAKPDGFEDWTDTEKELWYRSIDPDTLKAFYEIVSDLSAKRLEVINLVSKITKASLPKVDPESLDISRRDGEEQFSQKELREAATKLYKPKKLSIQDQAFNSLLEDDE